MHEKYEIMISGYIDGELDKNEEKELMLHLENCSDCAEYLAFVEKLSENLKLANEEPSPDFTEKIMGKLPFETSDNYKKENKFIKLFNKNSLATAACLAIIMIAALFAFPKMGGTDKAADMVAAPQVAEESALNEDKNEVGPAFGSATAPTETEKNMLESGLMAALNDISAESPKLRIYDSSGGLVFERADGVKLIDALLSESYEVERKYISKKNLEILFTAENSDLNLNVYIEDKSFYFYSEDFDSTFCTNENFYDFIEALFDFRLRA